MCIDILCKCKYLRMSKAEASDPKRRAEYTLAKFFRIRAPKWPFLPDMRDWKKPGATSRGKIRQIMRSQNYFQTILRTRAIKNNVKRFLDGDSSRISDKNGHMRASADKKVVRCNRETDPRVKKQGHLTKKRGRAVRTSLHQSKCSSSLQAMRLRETT